MLKYKEHERFELIHNYTPFEIIELPLTTIAEFPRDLLRPNSKHTRLPSLIWDGKDIIVDRESDFVIVPITKFESQKDLYHVTNKLLKLAIKNGYKAHSLVKGHAVMPCYEWGFDFPWEVGVAII